MLPFSLRAVGLALTSLLFFSYHLSICGSTHTHLAHISQFALLRTGADEMPSFLRPPSDVGGVSSQNTQP